MRWERLFADLEAQLEVLEAADRAAEVAETTRAERGQIALSDRLLASLTRPMRIRVRGIGWLQAAARDLGSDWVLLETGPDRDARGRQLLVPLSAVSGVEGLPRAADPDRAGASRRFGLRHALRGVSRDRAVVRVHDVDGDHASGTIDRVLADHVDLALHPDDGVPRRGAVRGQRSVPFEAIAAVRRL